MAFSVVIFRLSASAPFGWHVDALHPDALYIESVAACANSAVARYNACAAEGLEIRAGDYITHVDGAAICAGGAGGLDSKTRVVVGLVRPAQYSIQLARGDQPLGLEITYTAVGTTAYIAGVHNGVVKEQAPQVRPGDRIVRVNGEALLFEKERTALTGSQLKIELVRTPTASGCVSFSSC